jgi:CheY-like chemotaxis protein
LGRGSVFHFTAHFQVQTQGPAGALSKVTSMMNGLRVLVVDDNYTNRLILREMLSNRGAEVDEADNGPNALEQIESARASGAPYKLMLLDCRMPGMDGFEVAGRVKALSDQGLTVLMLSSDDLKIQLSRAHELGLDAHVVKPVRRADLFEAIGTAMVNRASRPVPEVNRTLRSIGLPTIHAAPDTQLDIPLNILLADDSTDNRLLIHAYLKDTGYLLEDAVNGAIALAKLKTGKYDLALMDIQMPVMDGLEATRLIRDWERERGLPKMLIFALSASAVEEDVRRALEAGVDMHISKPIKKTVLVAAIKKSIRSRSTHAIVKTSDDTAA